MQLQLLSGIDKYAMREYITSQTSGKELQRIGILIGAKMDLYDMAKHLRWGYLPKEELLKRGLSEEQVKSLKNEVRKAEQLYEAVGGSRLHFAQAILEGRGNSDGAIKVDYTTLENVPTSPEEQIISATSAQILASLKAQVEGLAGTLDSSGEGLSSASDTLIKIGGIAQSIATITNALAASTSGQTAPSDIHQVPERQAGFGEWFKDNQSTVVTASALLAAGFLITKMNVPKEERKNRKGGELSGLKKRPTGRHTAKKTKTKTRRATGRHGSGRRSARLAVIELM